MTRILKIVAGVAGLCLAASLVWAQPANRGGGAGRAAGGAMPASVEQTLGTLALNPEFGITDEQLLQLRTVLRGAYQEQLQMQESMRAGDMDVEVLRETMTAMRDDMTAKLASVLTPEQLELYTLSLESRRGQRGQGNRQRGG